jgi:hypothetical protein
LKTFCAQHFPLEQKSESGHATNAQLQAIKNIQRAGGYAEICHDIDAAFAVLEAWGLLRRNRILKS